MLNEAGKLIGDFTVAQVPGADRFLVWGSSAAQIYHMRWFEAHLPADGSVRVERLGHAADGPDARRAAVARGAGGARPTTTCRTRPSASWTIGRWTWRGVPAMVEPDQLYRRSRLRDLGRALLPAHALPRGEGGGGRRRHRRLRDAGAALDAAGEELADLVRRAAADLRRLRGRHGAVREARQERLHRPRRRRRARPRPGPRLRRVEPGHRRGRTPT